MTKFFLNEAAIIVAIIVNAICIILTEYDVESPLIDVVDVLCSLFFIVEMSIKLRTLGVRGYLADRWNWLDGTVTLLSVPSIIMIFVEPLGIDLSAFLVLRMMRVLRILRTVRFFPGFDAVLRGFRLAMTQSWPVLISFFLIIAIFALLNCAMFSNAAPEYFGTPTSSMYSIFRLCTIEGWYEIPDAVADGFNHPVAGVIRLYFSLLLIIGGIIGMSFINSIFVDAMVSDNNDSVEAKLDELNAKIDELRALLGSDDKSKV
ncbi:MAG: ion transporter [Bacteroidales bacterium]|nr:ion transporter [Bacteroidales bacterium]